MQLTDTEIQLIKNHLAVLESEHRDLDVIISHLEATAFSNQLTLQRLKKRKLSLKDEITRLQIQLVPDIPA